MTFGIDLDGCRGGKVFELVQFSDFHYFGFAQVRDFVVDPAVSAEFCLTIPVSQSYRKKKMISLAVIELGNSPAECSCILIWLKLDAIHVLMACQKMAVETGIGTYVVESIARV
jgi:hypothetical protein